MFVIVVNKYIPKFNYFGLPICSLLCNKHTNMQLDLTLICYQSSLRERPWERSSNMVNMSSTVWGMTQRKVQETSFYMDGWVVIVGCTVHKIAILFVMIYGKHFDKMSTIVWIDCVLLWINCFNMVPHYYFLNKLLLNIYCLMKYINLENEIHDVWDKTESRMFLFLQYCNFVKRKSAENNLILKINYES